MGLRGGLREAPILKESLVKGLGGLGFRVYMVYGLGFTWFRVLG